MFVGVVLTCYVVRKRCFQGSEFKCLKSVAFSGVLGGISMEKKFLCIDTRLLEKEDNIEKSEENT